MTPLNDALNNLTQLEVGTVLRDEPLANHCSWQIGGPADLLVEPNSVAQICTLVEFCSRNDLPVVCIGQGTNLLFSDAGVRGVVLKLGANFSRIEISAQTIVAEAGSWVPQLARMAMRSGLAGLEHCIGIPGTLGGLVMMNGGSQRKAIGENIRRIWLVDRLGREVEVSAADCDFRYRHSNLSGRGVVVRVELECPSGEIAEIRRDMVCDLRERRRKFPRKIPNCGSVFLSTSEMHSSVGPPGKIIEEAGLKGTRIGDAEISQQHANFILNRGSATAADVLSLISLVRKTILQKVGFDMRCEVRFVETNGSIVPADVVVPE